MPFFLNQKEIRDFVGATYFERGLDYFQRKRVSAIFYDEGNGRDNKQTISGIVRGSEDYETSLYFRDDELSDSECSCPIGSECKHVAALYLAAIENVPVSAHELTIKNKQDAQPSKKPVPQWESFFQATKKVSPPENPVCSVDLLFRIEETPASPLRLSIRPRIFDPVTEKYRLTDFRWKDVLSQSYKFLDANISPQAKSFLYQMVKVLFSYDSYWGYDRDENWLSIKHEVAPLVWNLFQEAHTRGVRLISGEKGDTPLHIEEDPVTPTAVIYDHTENDIGVQVSPFVNGQPIETSGLMFIGNPPVFAVSFQINTQERSRSLPLPISLYSILAKNISTFQRMMNQNIVIPEQDIKKFQTRFLPDFFQEIEVVSCSKKCSLPERIVPKLFIKILRKDVFGIRIELYWKYDVHIFSLYKSGNIISQKNQRIFREKYIEGVLLEWMTHTVDRLSIFFLDESKKLRESAELEKMDAAYFLHEMLPEMSLNESVLVEKDSDLPLFTEETEAPETEFSLIESQDRGHDWFDLSINVNLNGEAISFLEIFTALADNEENLFLSSGRYISLKTPFFENLKKLIDEARHLIVGGGDQISISRYQVSWWEELKQLGIVTKQAQRWEEATRALLSHPEIENPQCPEKLQATLRSYQEDGFAWMHFLVSFGMGGILADDMGLGKTVQTIALLCKMQESLLGENKCLIIAPTSVVENWDNELERFAPDISRVVLRSGDRAQLHKSIPNMNIVVTSYALLHRDYEILQKESWKLVILDEAQSIKNYQSKSHHLIKKFEANSKIALTGTPLENNLMELWSIFSAVSPGLFPSPENFRDTYQRPIEKESNTEKLGLLRRNIRPFLLRRTKEMVEKELPPKTQQILFLEMDKEQRRVYDLYLQHERQKVLGLLQSGGLKKNRFEILTSLMRLRQLCLYAGLVDKKYENIPSVKIDALLEQVSEIIAGNHKALVFSQFTSFLKKIQPRIDESQIQYTYLDGNTRKRKEVISRFTNDPDVKLFLISIKAGGFGLNLTASDYCIILDPWWNPAVEAQAIDRAHRIGQTKPVMVYKFIVKNTIEEKVLALQEKKQKLFKNVLDDGAVFGSLITEDDIRNIFEA